mgnify:CR=1 FL=1
MHFSNLGNGIYGEIHVPTTEQCKHQLFKIGIELGVSPKLISTRLLSEDDKNDMVAGLIDHTTLVTAVEVWISNGMPNYAQGSTERYKPSCELPMKRYRGMGKS